MSVFHKAVFSGRHYLKYTADLPTSPATFADDTAILATDSDPAIASQKLHTHLNALHTWLHKWRMQANALKSVHFTFTTRTGMCPLDHMNNVQNKSIKLLHALVARQQVINESPPPPLQAHLSTIFFKSHFICTLN
jgi:hypothetical protein